MQSVDGSTPEANREGGPLCYARKGGAQPGEPKKHKWNGLAHPHVQWQDAAQSLQELRDTQEKVLV